MNWPAPTLLPPPEDECIAAGRPPLAVPAPTDRSEPAGGPGLLATTAPAMWVGLVGGTLVLLAAAIVVVSNWSTIGRSVRFAGFVVVTAALIALAERLRRVVPISAGIIAHVGSFLTAGVGIAGLSLLGATWPACLVVGGVIAVTTTEIQARRWQRSTFRSGQIAGLAMAATGLAALTETTGGLIAVVAAAALMAVGAQRRAIGLSIVALLSPVLTALADAGIGAGTLERAGLVGDRLSWSGPIVGVMAAMVLGIAATQRRNNGLMLMAGAAPVIGLVTGLAAVDGSIVAWLSVPALIVMAGELAWWLLPGDRARRHVALGINGIAATLAVITTVGPQLAVTDPSDGFVRAPWGIPAALTTLALMLTFVRLRADDHALIDLCIAGVASGLIAGAVAFDLPPAAIATLAATTVVVAAFASRRLHPLAIYVPAGWALMSIIDVEPDLSTGRFVLGSVLLVGLLGTILAARTRLAADRHWIGWIELSTVTTIAAVAAVAFVPDHGPAAMLALGAAISVVAMLLDRRLLVWGACIIGALGFVATDAATSGAQVDPTFWIGWMVAALGLATTWWFTRSQIASHGATAALVIAAATSTAAVPVTAEEFVILAMIAVAALTGPAITRTRRSPLDAAAIAAGGVLLAATAFSVEPAWISAIWVVLGLQLMSYGFALHQRPTTTAGGLVTAVAGGSWWFTSGLHDWFLEAIAPAGITVGDVWAATASIMALVVGIAARRQLAVSSWLAYSAPLAVAGLWLTSVQIDRDTVWALPLAITIGLVAVAIGGWRRLAAPLVGGTVLTAITIFVASGSDLRAIPTWAWLAVGGSALLGVAVLIERAGKPDADGLEGLVDRWR